MKGFSILILLSLLLFPDYAFSQTCPCDTLELPNGTTGNDIVEIVCPGGELTEDAVSNVNADVVGISLEGNAFYSVLTPPDLPRVCFIEYAGQIDSITQLSDQEALNCRARLISGCNLQRISPIPTLSEWGMIAMAGVLGVIGLYAVMRRRKAAA